MFYIKKPIEILLPIIDEIGFIGEKYEGIDLFKGDQQINRFIVIWIHEGQGIINYEGVKHHFTSNQIFFLSPFQPFSFNLTQPVRATVLQFHPGFFCIHKNNHQVPCRGVLFDVIYGQPLLNISESDESSLNFFIEGIFEELEVEDDKQFVSIVNYLKSFLLRATRIKSDQKSIPQKGKAQLHLRITQALEENYRKLHYPADYADLLDVPVKSLSKVTKKYYGKTLSELISAKIILVAKTNLYLTGMSVKELAYDLGFNDELYFNRFFKKCTGVPPGEYRKRVGSDMRRKLAEGLQFGG